MRESSKKREPKAAIIAPKATGRGIKKGDPVDDLGLGKEFNLGLKK